MRVPSAMVTPLHRGTAFPPQQPHHTSSLSHCPRNCHRTLTGMGTKEPSSCPQPSGKIFTVPVAQLGTGSKRETPGAECEVSWGSLGSQVPDHFSLSCSQARKICGPSESWQSQITALGCLYFCQLPTRGGLERTSLMSTRDHPPHPSHLPHSRCQG